MSDECECPVHGRPQPCPYCGFERMRDRAEMAAEMKADEMREEPYGQTN